MNKELKAGIEADSSTTVQDTSVRQPCTKLNVRRSAYDVMLETLTKQVKTKKNKQDWGELKIRTEVSKDEYRKFISVENQCVGFCFNMRGNFLGMYNWKD